jgi:hypothetical protein
MTELFKDLVTPNVFRGVHGREATLSQASIEQDAVGKAVSDGPLENRGYLIRHLQSKLRESQYERYGGASSRIAKSISPASREVAVELASRYEIFQKRSGQQPTWVESAISLDDARNRLHELAMMFPADYFICDFETACFVVPFDRGSRPASEGSSDCPDGFESTLGRITKKLAGVLR